MPGLSLDEIEELMMEEDEMDEIQLRRKKRKEVKEHNKPRKLKPLDYYEDND